MDTKNLWFRNYVALLLSQDDQGKNTLFFSVNAQVNLLVWRLCDAHCVVNVDFGLYLTAWTGQDEV